DDCQYQRCRVELKQTPKIRTPRILRGDAVSGKPIFIEPYVEKKYRHEPSEIEYVFLDRNAPDNYMTWRSDENMARAYITQRGCGNVKSGIGIRKAQKEMGEKEVKYHA